MTKLSYRKGVPAALLLELIVGRPTSPRRRTMRGRLGVGRISAPPTSRHVFKAFRTTPRRRAR